MRIDENPSDTGQTMRGLLQQSLQGPQDLTLVTNLDRPDPGPDDYLIRVSVAGMNFADVMQTHGTYGGGPQPPYVAGFEAAGEIVGIGQHVENPMPLGTHVVGTGPGAFAQYMTMPAAAVLRVPASWADAEALGMVLNWATALAALRPLGAIQPGETLLVHAGGGGVGQAAVRLGLHYGARVVTTASPEKHGAVERLGADIVLDSRRPDLAETINQLTGGVDLVLESVGRATFETSLCVTKPFIGRIIVFGAASGDACLSTHDLVFRNQVQVKGLHIGAFATMAPKLYQELIIELEKLIASGVYPPGTPEVHPLAKGSEVLRLLEERHTTGKHALDPWRGCRVNPEGSH